MLMNKALKLISLWAIDFGLEIINLINIFQMKLVINLLLGVF